jgi:hypothetical protein
VNHVSWANLPSIATALASLFVGIQAALIWRDASMIPTDPGWRTGLPMAGADAMKPIEPVEQSQAQMGWIVAIMDANAKSADLNRKAAIWTAWAVGLSVASGLFGTIATIF